MCERPIAAIGLGVVLVLTDVDVAVGRDGDARGAVDVRGPDERRDRELLVHVRHGHPLGRLDALDVRIALGGRKARRGGGGTVCARANGARHAAPIRIA
jgi:hypothetical protein